MEPRKFIPSLMRADDIDEGEEQHVTISADLTTHGTSGESIVELMFSVQDSKATAIYVAVRPNEMIDLILNAVRGGVQNKPS